MSTGCACSVHAGERRRYWCSVLLTVFGVDIEERRQVQPALVTDARGYGTVAHWAMFWQATVLAMIDAYNNPLPGGPSREAQVCSVYLEAWRVRRLIPGFVIEHQPRSALARRGRRGTCWGGAGRGSRRCACPAPGTRYTPGTSWRRRSALSIEERTPRRLKDKALSAIRQFAWLDRQSAKRVKRSDGSYAAIYPDLPFRARGASGRPRIIGREVGPPRGGRAGAARTAGPARAAFWDLDQRGYPDREIAELCGVSISTVGATLKRARDKIKRAGAA